MIEKILLILEIQDEYYAESLLHGSGMRQDGHNLLSMFCFCAGQGMLAHELSAGSFAPAQKPHVMIPRNSGASRGRLVRLY